VSGDLSQLLGSPVEQGKPEKYRMICISEAFHGRTMGAISAAPRSYMIDGFGPLLDGFDIVPFNDIAALEKAITPATAAIHIETVQGEGGIRPHSQAYIDAMVALSQKHDLLIFLDEVQCGMGRTGKLFAYEHFGFTPDLLCTAKGIGAGFPLGALFATERVAKHMVAGTHGSTYGGNPLAMAVGNAVLDVMLADGFFADVERRAQHLAEGLQNLAAQFPKLYAVHRGLGMMQGVQCQPDIPVRKLIEVMHGEGVISIPAGNNTVRILPPLIISEKEIDEGITAMHHASQKFMETLS
ncbi:MAG TPA: aminotransferase class III-fold pyridoxal phosphate-dependent enzyme, partial [Alphaproteobacteria bacterium]|nr:aminotransferase class III-fold pyridoxal phosphate-dependent enzyme [Alphaproteobacteria bacterium]